MDQDEKRCSIRVRGAPRDMTSEEVRKYFTNLARLKCRPKRMTDEFIVTFKTYNDLRGVLQMLEGGKVKIEGHSVRISPFLPLDK